LNLETVITCSANLGISVAAYVTSHVDFFVFEELEV
jgi:hypothetical protein